MEKPRLIVANTTEEFIHTAAGAIAATITQAIAQQGEASIVLSGGTTPRAVFEALVKEHHDLLWSKVHFFFGDERSVPPDHTDSNYRMAKESLFDPLAIDPATIHRIEAELPAAEAAQRYNNMVAQYLRTHKNFDLLLLGIGDDGHTASLFPSTTALQEENEFVVANHVEKLKTDRITLTYKALEHSNAIYFLITGKAKQPALQRILSGDTILPATRVMQFANVSVTIFADRAAIDEQQQ